jgi:hypothetical protein
MQLLSSVQARKITIQRPTTTRVPMLPITVAFTAPRQAASMPDSNSPNWLDVFMKLALSCTLYRSRASNLKA